MSKEWIYPLWNKIIGKLKSYLFSINWEDYFGATLFLSVSYFKEVFSRLIGELVLLTLAVYSRFVLGNPPVLPIIPDGVWYTGVVVLGYVTFVLCSYGFFMQRFGKDNVKGNSHGFPFLVTFVGDLIALMLGVPTYIIIPLSLILMTSLLVDGYEDQGRYGVLPLARLPLLVMLIWVGALGEFSEWDVVKSSLASIPLQGWGFLFIVVLVIVLSSMLINVMSQARLKKVTKTSKP